MKQLLSGMILCRCASIVFGIALGLAAAPLLPEPGYKPRRWEAGARESYPAKLASQGVTIAVRAMYTDRMAASVFDVADMVARGIMPLAVVIFNDNDFPVEVEGGSIEWIREDRRLHTLLPEQAAQICLQKDRRNVLMPRLPIPRIPSAAKIDQRAVDDFQQKFLGKRVVAGGGKEWGFLYFAAPAGDLRESVRVSRVYIPEIRRRDNGTSLIYFEIDLEPSVAAPSREEPTMPDRPDGYRVDRPYDGLLKDAPRLGDFRAAEETRCGLENFRQRFFASSDKKCGEYCRRPALRGRRVAELSGRNPAVGAAKRREKRKIAFRSPIRLEWPEPFRDWRQLRKNTAGYRRVTEPATMRAHADR